MAAFGIRAIIFVASAAIGLLSTFPGWGITAAATTLLPLVMFGRALGARRAGQAAKR